MNKNFKVVITGIGLISASGNLLDTWKSCISGKSAIRPLKRKNLRTNIISIGGEIESNLDDIFPKRINTYLPRSAKLAGKSLKNCINDANVQNLKETGFIYGTTSLGIDNCLKIYKPFIEDVNMLDPRKFLGISPAGIAQYISNFFQITGITKSIVKASASGLSTLIDGYLAIKQGLTKQIFCSSADDNLYDEIILFYKKILGRKRNFFGNNLRSPHVIPFAKPEISDRGVLSEAGVTILLESEEHAKKRNAKIYAEITNIGDYFYSDGLSGEDNNQYGIKKAIKSAIEKNKIEYSIQPATGYWLLDYRNYKAISELAPKSYTTTIEPIVGHTGGPSGLLNTAMACMSIKYNKLIPTYNINLSNLDPEFNLKIIPNKPISQPVSNVLIISSGYGGYNNSIFIKKYK